MTGAATIAAQLSEAQKRAFRAAKRNPTTGFWNIPVYRDRGANREIADGDTVIFAKGTADQLPADRSYNDLKDSP